jgi:short-subunit dehydrogenase
MPHRNARTEHEVVDMRRYDSQVAVVTGASSGIGRRVACDLSTRGAVVIGLARRGDLLLELRGELRKHSSESDTMTCDVAARERLRSCLTEIEGRHGRVDILVNNAGIHAETKVTESVDDRYDKIIATNFMSAVVATSTVAPGMAARRQGVIVNVSSDSARAPEAKEGAYAASKAALSAFSESAAQELIGFGVHVHVLYPAWVPTAMGLGDGTGSLPPKAVRRTDAQVSSLLLERIGSPRVDINASRLPLLAVLARTVAPTMYAKAMRRYAAQA